MAAIIQSRSGNNVYLYESESYRTKDGKVRNRRRIVGKIDPSTGERVFKPEYLEEKGVASFGGVGEDQRLYSVNDVRNSKVKELGVSHLLGTISRHIGLTKALRESIPDSYREILNLAFYMVASGEPALYCEDWLYKTDHEPGRHLSSQRISELMQSVSQCDRNLFYETWGEYRCENEYIALDITSVSTYSEQINHAEWGYNRDKEKLPQVNICMLLGEKSRLPVFQTVYSGSLRDVSTLRSTLGFAAGVRLDRISVVMDKGFASTKNINEMLGGDEQTRFLIALPFSMAFPKKLVESVRAGIGSVENTVVAGADVLRGASLVRKWGGNDVYAHAFFNSQALASAKNNLYEKVQSIFKKAKAQPNVYESDPCAKRYLTFHKEGGSIRGVSINREAVERELANTGWLILLSNHVSDMEEAIEVYRHKDVLEKGFQQMKNCLDLARLRVHSDDAMQNKIFVGFVALILMAHINKVMSETHLFKNWTIKKMFKCLERITVHYIKNNRIVSPLTKDQKSFLEVFDVSLDL